jgi:hypothetical protein
MLLIKKGVYMNKFIWLILSCYFIVNSQNISLSYNSFSNAHRIGTSKDSIGINIHTSHTDSTIVCNIDTCYWSYNSIYDTSIIYNVCNWWKIDISFTLFDSNNRTFRIFPPALFYDYQSGMHSQSQYRYIIDSIYGDTITKSGQNLNITAFFHGCNDFSIINDVTISCIAIDSSSSTISYRISPSINLPFDSVNIKLFKSISVITNYYNRSNQYYYLLNGRLIKNSDIINKFKLKQHNKSLKH